MSMPSANWTVQNWRYAWRGSRWISGSRGYGRMRGVHDGLTVISRHGLGKSQGVQEGCHLVNLLVCQQSDQIELAAMAAILRKDS